MERQVNMKVGDIVLVRYVAKYGRDAFRLGRIVRLHPDQHGRVRTVSLWLRNRARAPRERAERCGQGVTELKAPVQRLVLILPAEEQPEEVLERLRAQVNLEPVEQAPAMSPHSADAGWQDTPEFNPPEDELATQRGALTRGAQPQQGGEAVETADLPPLPQREPPRRRAPHPSRDLVLSRNLSPVRPGGRKIGRI